MRPHEAAPSGGGPHRPGLGLDEPERPRLASYFHTLHHSFRATMPEGAEDRYYDLAGFRVNLRLTAPALEARLTRALAHRSVPSGPAALTVCAWESDPRSDPMPPAAWAREWSGRARPGETGGDGHDRMRALYVAVAGALSMLDADRNLALYRVRDARKAPAADSAAPLLHILNWWLARHGRFVVHAAGVGTPTGGVLLAGQGGAGKSTTTLACLPSELLHAGDDYVVLGENPGPVVHSLYQSARVHPDQLSRMPYLASRANDPGRLHWGKMLLFLDEGYRDKLTDSFPIRAVLVLRVTGLRDTRLRPTTSERALDALIPSTVVELPGLGRDGVRAVTRIVRSVPSYVLELGTDLERIPAVILDLLAHG